MANLKSGLDYYPMSVDFFEDDKIGLIEGQFGINGTYIIMRLLSKLYKFGYYLQWGEDEALLFSRSLPANSGITLNFVRQVVTQSVKRSLFDDTLFNRLNVLTSKGIQRRYFEAVKRRQSITVDARYLLVDVRKMPNVNIIGENVNIIGENVCSLRQRKEKERKYPPPLSSPLQGEASSGEEEGGGIFGILSRREEGKPAPAGSPIRDRLSCIGMDKDYIWELERLSDRFGRNRATGMIEEWIRTDTTGRHYELVQRLQRMERRGEIQPCMPWKRWQIFVWLSDNLPPSDVRRISEAVRGDEDKVRELEALIGECRKGGINHPAAFIMKRLTERRDA